VDADLATLVARFTAALRRSGMAVDVEAATRFAAGVVAVGPTRVSELYWIARVTLVTDSATLPVFETVFRSVFRDADLTDPVENRGDQHAPPPVTAGATPRTGPAGATAASVTADRPHGTAGDGTDREIAVAASAAERLGGRDFAELTPAELLTLSEAMRRFRVATPLRPSRRFRPAPDGTSVDLRATLRRARRTGGQPVVLARRTRRTRPRRLVVLCDISGSMEPYARAMLQLLWCARTSGRAEVFTFATRLTRLTPVLARGGQPATALVRAAAHAPDWSSGSRIGDSIEEFSRHWGRRGTARGAVVLVVSDGWDTGDPEVLGREMARLRRVAHRIVWANPRTARPGFAPRARGIAAAWPHCDAVVSAHRLDALSELLDALRA
jgi:uncharacterized protein